MELEQNLKNATDYIPLRSFDHIYHGQHGNSRTATTTAVLTEDNLIGVSQAIATAVGDQFQCAVDVIPNANFFLYIETLLSEAPNFSNVQSVVDCLNREIVKHEVAEHCRGFRRRQLYLKWFIAKDRPVTIEHPIATNGRRRLDDRSTGDYGLSNPRRNAWQQFQWEQAQL